MTSPEECRRQPAENEVRRFLADLETWREHAGESEVDLWTHLAVINRSIAELTRISGSIRRRGPLAKTPSR